MHNYFLILAEFNPIQHCYTLYILIICNTYSKAGRSVADISGDIFTEAQSAEINMLPRSDIEAIDRPTVLSILYSMISVQQMNLLPENAS